MTKLFHTRTALLIFLLIIVSGFGGSKFQSNCPPEGRSRDGSVLSEKWQETNREKNRRTQPAFNDIDQSITLAKMLSSGDDPNKFNHNNGATIEGYIYEARDERKESCNCYSANHADYDVHVFISQNPHPSGIGQCAVIEITPYSRQMNSQWTSQYINQNFAGKKVKVTGWMLHDWEHTDVSYETNPLATHLERRTVWEIHPITNIQFE